MNEIAIKRLGVIREGKDHKGWYIKIEPYEEGATDFLIFLSSTKDFSGEVFDFWVESKEKLPVFFKEAFEQNGWVLEWLEGDAGTTV